MSLNLRLTPIKFQEWPTSIFSQQHQYIIILKETFMRINKMITQREMLWSLNKFFQLILYGNVWRSVWRICMWILGFKGLKGKYRILHNTSQMSAANEWNIFQHEKRNFLSPSDYVMCNVLFYYISTNEILIYYVAIATVIFSHVEITCYFHVWRYHVFIESSPGMSLVFI